MLFQQCNQVKWFKLQEANTWSSLHNEPSVLLRFLRKRRKVARDELPQDFTPPTNFSPIALAPRARPSRSPLAHLHSPENHEKDKAFYTVLA